MSEIKQTVNRGKIVGVLSEKALKISKGEVKTENKTFPCEVISGTLSVETENGTLPPLRVYLKSKKKDGTENKMFAGFVTIMKEYVSKMELTTGKISYKVQDSNAEKTVEIPIDKQVVTAPDTIECSVRLDLNDYVSNTTQKVVSSVQLSMSNAKRVSSDTELTTDLMIEGYVQKIVPETTKTEEETSRILVTFVTVGFGAKAKPFTVIVPEDLADDFSNMYEVGQTAMFYCSVVMRHVGGQKNNTAAFGKKAKVYSGFDVEEIVLIGGEEPYDEDTDEDGSSKSISANDVKSILKERKLMLEQKEKEAAENSNTPKSTKTTKGLGSIKSVEPTPFDDDNEDLPFDVPDDDVADLF